MRDGEISHVLDPIDALRAFAVLGAEFTMLEEPVGAVSREIDREIQNTVRRPAGF